MTKPAKNTICLWYDRDAEEAARFYAKTFPDSSVSAVHRAPGDYPSGKKGDVLTVEFTVMGIPCLGLNGGPVFKHNEAFSFQVATADQAETDRYWNAIVGNGGQESACGWCKDKWGMSWQITPLVLTKAITDPDPQPPTCIRGDDADEEASRALSRSAPHTWSTRTRQITICRTTNRRASRIRFHGRNSPVAASPCRGNGVEGGCVVNHSRRHRGQTRRNQDWLGCCVNVVPEPPAPLTQGPPSTDRPDRPRCRLSRARAARPE